MNSQSYMAKDFPDCTGSNIRKLRQDRKLTLKELANMIGETEASIRRIENGDRSLVSYTIIENIAAVFKCDIQSILPENNSLSKISIREQLLLCIRQLAGLMNAEEQRQRETKRLYKTFEIIIGELATTMEQLKD